MSSGSTAATGVISGPVVAAAPTPVPLLRYANMGDVQARIPTQLLVLDENSQPSQDLVEQWLDEQSLWIDATLRWRYAAPVTDLVDRGILRPICGALVAAQVWSVLGGHSAQVPSNAEQLRREAFQILAYDSRSGRAMIALGNTPWTDAGEASLGEPESTFTDPAADGSVDFAFKVGSDQW